MSGLLPITEELHQYILLNSLHEPPPLLKLRQETRKISCGHMMTLPDQAQFLCFLLKLMKAKNVIEVGAFTGYATAWMALALPREGRIVACDIEAKWLDIGRKYWQELGVENKIEVSIGDANDTLTNYLASNHEGSFDAVFIDADKLNYEKYYELSLMLIRLGGLIIFDNLLWSGKVMNNSNDNPSTVALRRLTKRLHADNRIHFSLLTIADGMGLVLKKDRTIFNAPE